MAQKRYSQFLNANIIPGERFTPNWLVSQFPLFLMLQEARPHHSGAHPDPTACGNANWNCPTKGVSHCESDDFLGDYISTPVPAPPHVTGV
jgi:hypothetical protein